MPNTGVEYSDLVPITWVLHRNKSLEILKNCFSKSVFTVEGKGNTSMKYGCFQILERNFFQNIGVKGLYQTEILSVEFSLKADGYCWCNGLELYVY